MLKITNKGFKVYTQYIETALKRREDETFTIVPLPFSILKTLEDGLIVEINETDNKLSQALLKRLTQDAEEVEFNLTESSAFPDAFKKGAKTLAEALEITLVDVAKGREAGGYNDVRRAELKAERQARGGV